MQLDEQNVLWQHLSCEYGLTLVSEMEIPKKRRLFLVEPEEEHRDDVKNYYRSEEK